MGKSSSDKKQKKTNWLSRSNVQWIIEKKKDNIFNSESDGTDFCIKLTRLLESRAPALVKALGGVA